MKNKNSKIEKQKEELGDTLREAAKLHLCINGYDENLIEFDFGETDSNGILIGKLDLVVLDKKTKKPIIIVNIDHPSFYDDDYDHVTANLQSQKFGFPDTHVLSYDGKKFTIIHRYQKLNNNTYDFLAELNKNEINELKNITSQNFYLIHREKYYFSYPIDSFDFADKYLRNHGIAVSDLVNMLLLKYIDETKNGGILFRSSTTINEQTISEIFENVESYQEYQLKNNARFQNCLEYFDTPIGELLRNCSISDSNPFELIKLISSLENLFRRSETTISKDIISFISQIQDIEKNSTIVLDNLSFSTVFEHIFVIIEKLGCKLEELDKFVNFFIINRDPVEHLKIKFIFNVLGINTDNIKYDFSELNIETKINYHISLKPFNQKFSKNLNDLDQVAKLQYGNDLSKYEIIDFINNVKNGTTMSFIVSPGMLFQESRSAKLFRYELLQNTKILAIIQLPKRSVTGISIEASLIILKKSKDTISNYKIFMSHIDKIGADLLFTNKEIIKKYNQFKNKKSLENETDLGFLVNTNELNENWFVFDKKPSQKAITKSLNFSNPVHLREVAEIIRPLRKHNKLDDVITSSELDDPLFDLKMIGEELKSKKISKELLDSSFFEPGDILFSITGKIGKTAKITTKIPNVGLSSGLVIIRPDTSKITSDYLKHVLDSKNTHIQVITKGSVIPFLSTTQLSDIKIELIELKKQKLIIEKIHALKNKIANLTIKILKYQNDIENIATKKT